jgi:hypothetical protein
MTDAQNKPGYINRNGSVRLNEKKNFESMGQLVIEYFLNNLRHETGNFQTFKDI